MGVTITLADYDAMTPGRRAAMKAWQSALDERRAELAAGGGNVDPDDWSEEAIEDWASNG